jgi:uncharacterized membrane protein
VGLNTEFNTLTRREALLSALKGTVAAAVIAPAFAQTAPEDSAKAEATFVPENDYPFFGYEPEPSVALAFDAEHLE